MKAYYYLFYRLARMNDILFPEYKDSDNFPIVGGVTTLLTINYLTLHEFYEYYFVGYNIIDKKIGILIIVLLLFINYFLLQWRGKDKKIYKMFENETKKERDRGLFYVWTYIILTHISFLAVFLLT